jgi:hypothetical protein
MARKSWWLVGILLGVLTNTGCCRWCERWCGPSHAQPVAYAPQQQCIPVCAPVCAPSSPVSGQWQRGPYGCP